MEKDIPLSLIDLPDFDLRFYRSKEFFNLFCRDIERSGVLVPPIVRGKPNGRFEVIDGVNRIKCVKEKLKWETVRCDIMTDQDNDVESIIKGLKINIFRASHDPMGTAYAFQRLCELGLKQKQIAKEFGFSKGHVSKLLALTKLPPDQQLALAKGQISIDEGYNFVRSRRDPNLMKRLGVTYRCIICEGRYGIAEGEHGFVCEECKQARKDQLRFERKKLERDRSQRGLDQ